MPQGNLSPWYDFEALMKPTYPRKVAGVEVKEVLYTILF